MTSFWIFWLIVALVLLIAELLSGSMVSMCLSLASAVAIIPAAMGVNFVWQIVVFLIGGIIALLFLRPVMRELGNNKETREYRTNMDALIGRTGKVTREITSLYDDGGRVQIDGDSWLAYTDSSEAPIRRGEQVEVLSYESLVLKVRRRV